MSTRPPVQPSAAPADFRSGAERRSPQFVQLQCLGMRVRKLVLDAGTMPARERHANEAAAIASELVSLFPAPPVHPPLWQRGSQALW